MTSILAALLLAAMDPCAPVVPVEADPAAAAEYRAVAQAEQEAGSRETAVAAWRAAAERDPADGSARAALAALCRAGAPAKPPVDPLPEAIRLLDAGRYREAAELLRAASARARPGGDAALLEGICRYELGEDAEAARLLREAETEPRHRETARLYLGLLALREGAAREAASLFDSAASSPTLGGLASELARSAQWDSPLLLSLLLEGGWDSNVSLTTSGAGSGLMPDGDAAAGLSVMALGRPFGANGLFVRAAGSTQRYTVARAYDFTSLEAAAGARWWRGGSGVTAEYAFTDRTLGGDAYLDSHRLLATGSLARGPFAFTGSWWGRWENYATAFAGYSGFAQRAEARLSLALGARVRLGAGWAAGRDDADLAWLGWKEHGPRADLRVVLGPTTRLTAEGGYAWRRYADRDPALTILQERLTQEVLDAAAAFEWDPWPRTTLRFSLSFRNTQSNLPDWEYTKWVPSAAVGLLLTP